MKEDRNIWIDYWSAKNIFKGKAMKKGMEIFIENTISLLNYNSQDVVLDIGCGLGYSAYFLKNIVKEIHCLDVSEWYIDLCKRKFAQESNIFLYKLNDNYIDFSFLNDIKFSIILCNGTIQYFRDITEVEDLIESVRGVALPGARFIISDIPNENFYLDLWGNIKGYLKHNSLLDLISFLYKARTSEYYKVRSKIGILALSKEDLNNLIVSKKLNARILDTPLTKNKYRRSLLIGF